MSADPGGATATTPGKLLLSRKNAPYVLKIRKHGYTPVDFKLDSDLNGLVILDALFGGLIAFSVDFASGAAFKIVPSSVHVDLTPLPEEQ